MSAPEIRWYKGKYKVEVLLKSKGNYRVRALENVLIGYSYCFSEEKALKTWKFIGEEFVSPPRLLWRHPRK